MNELPSLAAPLRSAIEAWADTLRENSPLAQVARSGGMTPRALAYYLVSLRFLFRNSEANLRRASACAEQQGRGALARYFAAKAREENGHDAWAHDDLTKLAAEAREQLQPGPAIVALVALQGSLIDEHPVLFVVYALWAEYFTVLLGDEWLDALAGCGFTRDQVSAIANHLEADRAHAAHAFAQIDELWEGTPPAGAMIEVVARAGSLFERFAAEVYAQTRYAA